MAMRIQGLFAAMRAARRAGSDDASLDGVLAQWIAAFRSARDISAPEAVRALGGEVPAVAAAQSRALSSMAATRDEDGASTPAMLMTGAGSTYVLLRDGEAAIGDTGGGLQIMPDGEARERDVEAIGLDGIALSGGYSGVLPAFAAGAAQVGLAPGSSYDLATQDGQVRAGGTFAVVGTRLGAGDSLTFDGSAETDGRFFLYGGQGSDDLTGGAGDDRIHGSGGADRLTGGGGRDVFVYTGASESSGGARDTLVGFTVGADRIDLEVAVTAVRAGVAGTLSSATLDADLSALLGDLVGGEAGLVRANGGDLAGRAFVVVDANGIAGYQAGEDYVIELADAPADLVLTTDLFI